MPRGHDDRGPGERWRASSGAGGVRPARRAAVWVLHAGADHVGCCAAGRRTCRLGRGDPRVHERQPLPLRRLSEHRGRHRRGRRAMNGTFEYVRADDVAAAVALVSGDSEAQYLAGGTTQIDLILKDGVLHPERLVDITRLPLRGISLRGDALVVGALTTMEELAADPSLGERAAFVREALLAGASTQLRNMATIGGNLLQRKRCRYFRDASVATCNKRTTPNGGAAVTGPARMHAILGASEQCIAVHASDLCVPLVALDAVVHAQGTDGRRTIPLTEFYRLPGDRPDLENVLAHGELITAIEIPLLPT